MPKPLKANPSETITINKISPITDGVNAIQITKSDKTTNLITIDSVNNRISIGSSLSSARLSVYSVNSAVDGFGQAFFCTTDAYGTNIGGQISFGGNFSDGNTTLFAAIAGRKENAINGDYAGYLQFSTRVNGGVVTERMRIDPFGQISIGSPSVRNSKLEVFGDGTTLSGIGSTGVSIAGFLRLGRTNGTLTSPAPINNNENVGRLIFMGQYDTIEAHNAFGAEIRGTSSGNYVSATNCPTDLIFYTSSTSEILKERMRITSLGNVGIGMNPVRALDVLGSIGVGRYALGAEIALNRTNGSEFSPEVTVNGDIIGSISWRAWYGSSLTTSSAIRCTSDGGWTIGNYPSYLSFYTKNIERMRITSSGTVFMYSLSGSTGGSDLRYNTSSKEIFYDTSALKYKENIRPIENTERIYNLKVVLYDRKDGSVKNEVGLIADEVEKIIPEIVCYNENNEIESYNKSDLIPYLLNEIQKLNKELKDLKNTLKFNKNKSDQNVA